MLDCSLDPLAGSDADYGLEWPKKRRDFEKKIPGPCAYPCGELYGSNGR